MADVDNLKNGENCLSHSDEIKVMDFPEQFGQAKSSTCKMIIPGLIWFVAINDWCIMLVQARSFFFYLS